MKEIKLGLVRLYNFLSHILCPVPGDPLPIGDNVVCVLAVAVVYLSIFYHLIQHLSVFSSLYIIFLLPYIFQKRYAVGSQSLIDFNMRLLSSHFEDNLGRPGRGSSVTDLFLLYFLMMSFN